MNKKVLGILAASATALGSAMIATPVRAQSATLPVTIEVTPAIFLRTYKDLTFIVNQQDLASGSSVDNTTSYDEQSITALPTTSPGAGGDGTVTKRIPVLYQVWRSSTEADIQVTATKSTLQSVITDDFGQTTTEEVTMTVTDEELENAPDGGPYKQAGADFKFTFPDNIELSDNTTFTGGEIEIRVVTP